MKNWNELPQSTSIRLTGCGSVTRSVHSTRTARSVRQAGLSGTETALPATKRSAPEPAAAPSASTCTPNPVPWLSYTERSIGSPCQS